MLFLQCYVGHFALFILPVGTFPHWNFRSFSRRKYSAIESRYPARYPCCSGAARKGNETRNVLIPTLVSSALGTKECVAIYNHMSRSVRQYGITCLKVPDNMESHAPKCQFAITCPEVSDRTQSHAPKCPYAITCPEVSVCNHMP